MSHTGTKTMDNNILIFTDKRFRAANIEGIATRETKQLYSEFTSAKADWFNAMDRHHNAQALLAQGAKSVKFDIIEAKRAMNAAETKLTHLAQAIGNAILAARRSAKSFRRIDYRPKPADSRA